MIKLKRLYNDTGAGLEILCLPVKAGNSRLVSHQCDIANGVHDIPASCSRLVAYSVAFTNGRNATDLRLRDIENSGGGGNRTRVRRYLNEHSPSAASR